MIWFSCCNKSNLNVAKYPSWDKSSHIQRLFSIDLVHKAQQQCLVCDLDLWSLALKNDRYRSLVKTSIYMKFDGPSSNGLVCDMLLGLLTMLSIWPSPLTPDLEKHKALSLSLLICVPSSTVPSQMVWSVTCLLGLLTMISMWPWPLTHDFKPQHYKVGAHQ